MPEPVLGSPPNPLDRIRGFPRIRFMGSKYRLLPWIHPVLAALPFDTALDAFSGSGCVGYMLKCMGKSVTTNDFLAFPQQIAQGVIANSSRRLTTEQVDRLLRERPDRNRFIQKTFSGIFFSPRELRLLDELWANLPELPHPDLRALALAAAVRACAKRQPRGVFTVAGDPERYKDGRRDLRLGLRKLIQESAAAYGAAVFDGGAPCRALRSDVFDLAPEGHDLVYLDPPYVPRADDNCYVKRYHFLEGLVSYWQDPGTEVMVSSRVRKIPKRATPFSHRRTAIQAFEALIERFRHSILVLSYSTNGYPDQDTLVKIMSRHKRSVEVLERTHRYHFGTHARVAPERTSVQEYLLVGR